MPGLPLRDLAPRFTSSLFACLLALTTLPTAAQGAGTPPVALLGSLNAQVEADTDRLTTLFKDIHQHPELAFMEKRTAGIIARELRSLGFEVKDGIGMTGVAAIYRNGQGPTVMYRADMDANAVEEATGLPYASTVRVKREDGSETPVAHMCGHDAHVVWMLGMAKAMVALKDQWKGTLVLIGQPAEEVIGGAAAMVKDGLYERHDIPVPDYLLALHTAPMPIGVVAARSGTMMAGTDQIDVTFHGHGGHGSQPHMTKDPVVMAAMAVTQYQTLISRQNNPLDPAVLTVGAFQAGNSNNVIPDSAHLKLNLRFFDTTVQERLRQGIAAINQGIAVANGLPEAQVPALVFKGSSPPLVNDAALLGRVQGYLRGLLGEQRVTDKLPLAMGSEDVHQLKGPHTRVPLAYMLVGVADPQVFQQATRKGLMVPYQAHSPHYVVDLAAIPMGTRLATLSVLSLLGG